MNHINKTVIVGTFALFTLAGCAAVTNLAAVIASATGQSFLAALGTGGTLIPGIQTVLSDIDNGIATNGITALNTVCYALPWADGAVDLFGPVDGMTTTTITQVDDAVKAFQAGPCTNPPTNLAQAITEGGALFLALEQDLQTGGVPVSVPTSTTVLPAL